MTRLLAMGDRRRSVIVFALFFSWLLASAGLATA